jgi:hypothetical protein
MKAKALLSLFERLVRVGDAGAYIPAPDNACWLWPGAKDRKRYGLIKVDGKTRRVYRAAYELATGRKLGERTAEHKCRNPSCWRPSHIEPMSRSENTALGNKANPRSTEKARAALACRRAEVIYGRVQE